MTTSIVLLNFSMTATYWMIRLTFSWPLMDDLSTYLVGTFIIEVSSPLL